MSFQALVEVISISGVVLAGVAEALEDIHVLHSKIMIRIPGYESKRPPLLFELRLVVQGCLGSNAHREISNECSNRKESKFCI